MSDDTDLFDTNADDESVLPGTGLPGKRRKAFKASGDTATSDKSASSKAEPSPAEPIKPTSPPQPKAVAAKEAPRRGFDWLLLFPLLIVIAAGYSGWQWYQSMLEPALGTVTENRDNLVVLGERQQVVLGQQAELLETIKQQSSSDLHWQKQQEEKLGALQKRMNRLDRSARSQAILVEVGSLMRQADRLIRFEQDLPAAAATLRLADTLLLELNDSGAEYVRGVLANDLQHLDSALSVDRTAVYLQLNQIMQGVDAWPLLQTPRSSFVPPAAVIVDDNAQGFKRHWENLLARLQSLVILRPREVRDQPMLPPEQSWLLRENIRLQLQQAQWAAVHAEPIIFESSVAQAKSWIERYFDRQDVDVKRARSQLNALLKTPVSMPAIDISATQKALASYRLEMTVVHEEAAQ